MSLTTCRFCGEWSHSGDRMVKYGVRHYAHFACYLDAGKSLADLHDWQIAEFPYLLLKERGLRPVADAAIERIAADRDQVRK